MEPIIQILASFSPVVVGLLVSIFILNYIVYILITSRNKTALTEQEFMSQVYIMYKDLRTESESLRDELSETVGQLQMIHHLLKEVSGRLEAWAVVQPSKQDIEELSNMLRGKFH